MSPEERYRRLGRLIESAPDFSGNAALSAAQLTWLGRASALIDATNSLGFRTDFAVASSRINAQFQRQSAFQEIIIVLYKALAEAELHAPAAAQGAFIPVGNSFDAFAALAKILGSAASDVLVVDPYMDDTVIVDFGGSAGESVTLRLLTDAATAKPNLTPAAIRWKTQYSARKLELRLAPARTLHDRAIFIDQTQAWTITQSLKDLAKRSPAEIIRADDTAALKIAAYESIWSSAAVVT